MRLCRMILARGQTMKRIGLISIFLRLITALVKRSMLFVKIPDTKSALMNFDPSREIYFMSVLDLTILGSERNF